MGDDGEEEEGGEGDGRAFVGCEGIEVETYVFEINHRCGCTMKLELEVGTFLFLVTNQYMSDSA